jgi:hypothetical protein
MRIVKREQLPPEVTTICDECQGRVDKVVRLGAWKLCEDCLVNALGLIRFREDVIEEQQP